MKSDGIMTATREVTIISYPGEWPSGKATDFESVYRGFESLLPSLKEQSLSLPRLDWR